MYAGCNNYGDAEDIVEQIREILGRGHEAEIITDGGKHWMVDIDAELKIDVIEYDDRLNEPYIEVRERFRENGTPIKARAIRQLIEHTKTGRVVYEIVKADYLQTIKKIEQ